MLANLLPIVIIATFTSLTWGVNDSNVVSNYFNKVYSAEMHLITGNNEKSMELYVSAFDFGKGQKIIFLKDLHNALMLAYQNENYHYFEKFLYYLNSFDVDSSFFQSVGYENIGESGFSTLAHTFFDNKQTMESRPSVCSFFKRLMVLDQSIRNACREEYGNYYRFCGEEIALLDSLVLVQLLGYFNAYGIPTDSEFCNMTRYSTPSYRILIRHNLQWCRTEIIDYLKTKIGYIHPQILADILNRLNNNPCDGSEIKDPLGLSYHVRLGADLYIIEPDEELIEGINKNRLSLHLDNLTDFHNKLRFQELNPEYILFYPVLIRGIDGSSDFINSLRNDFKDYKVEERQ